ncbi:MAG TPA: S41 family peptidase [Phycisphaerales bacterium]
MRTSIISVIVSPALVLACCAWAQPASTTPAPAGGTARTGLIQFPTISPDGQVIVFSAAGDLWAIARTGGVATRLTSHPAEDRRAIFSPDGKSLAFESERDGPRNLYIASIDRTPEGVALGPVRRVTTVDRAQSLGSFSHEGSSLLFSAAHEPAIYRGNRLYRVSVHGGPIERMADCFGSLPRVSPDGSFVTFSRGRVDTTRTKYRGSGAPDLWKLNTSNNTLERLTSDPASDADAWPLADGSVLYVSSKSGEYNIRRIPAGKTDSGAVDVTNYQPTATELTIGHGVRDLGVNAPGTAAAFVLWDTLYTLDLSKEAKPVPVRVVFSADFADLDTQRLNVGREISEQALSPDGKTIAVIARGQVFVRCTDENFPTRRVTSGNARARGLAWSPDNRILYFTSDDTGTNQLYYATVALSKSDLIPPDEKKPEDKKDEKKPEEKKDDKPADAATKPEAEKADDKKQEDKKSEDKTDKKDDKKEPKKDKPDYAKRWAESITFTVHKLEPANLAPGKNDGVFGPELTNPTPSPDGKQLIFTRGLGDTILMDLATKNCRVLWEGWNSADISWASDSRHIVYANENLDFNSDIWLFDTKPGDDGTTPPAINLTRHPDLDIAPRLSADGKVLYFLSERGESNFQYQVSALFLDKSLETLRPYELEEYFKKAGEAAKKRKPIDPVEWDKPAEPAKPEAKPEAKEEVKADDAVKPDEKKDDKKSEDKKDDKKPEPAKPLRFDTTDAYLRIRRLTNGTPTGSGQLAITPGGERIAFVAAGEPDPSLVSISYKGDDRKTITSGNVGALTASFTGDKVTFTKSTPGGGGTSLNSSTFAGGKVDTLPIDAPITVDVAAQQRHKFMEAARILGNQFYHPTLKGLNWTGLAARYVTLAEKTRTVPEFAAVTMMLFGDLEGSHMGVFPPPGSGPGQINTGYLGIDHKPAPGGYEVTRIVPRSPAEGPTDPKAVRLLPGDVITMIDGEKLAADSASVPSVDLAAALIGKAGKETLVTFVRKTDTPGTDGTIKPRTILITPMSSGADVNLRYDDECEQRRLMVEKLSGGKLGYLHIRAMSQPQVDDYERDLFAAADGKLGLIIDVRDNGGGSTADILLASLTAPRHAYAASRGVDPATVKRDAYPRDRRLIYGYSREISVLINENSFSNAEIFAHAIKNIGRGKVVGTATYGGVISTGAASLIDGTQVRTPGRGWYVSKDHKDMDIFGAQPDIAVPQTPVDEAAGTDPQIEAAVKELLTRAKEPQ